MVRATLHIRVIPGQGRAFEHAWQSVAAYARAQPGNVRQTLLKDRSEADSYYISSDWTSAAAFTAFERSQKQDAMTEPLRKLRRSATMVISEVVGDVAGQMPR